MYKSQPWKHCSEPRNGVYCWKVFNDSKCDFQCNSEECLYDGFDCVLNIGTCNPHYDYTCSLLYADGVCNEGCNTPACNWDGLDCDHSKERLAFGSLVLTVGISPTQFRKESRLFLRQLGNLLRAIVLVKQNSYGEDMIFPWYDDNKSGTDRLRRAVLGNGMESVTQPGREPDGWVHL